MEECGGYSSGMGSPEAAAESPGMGSPEAAAESSAGLPGCFSGEFLASAPDHLHLKSWGGAPFPK